MSKKNNNKIAKSKKNEVVHGEPKFPYSTTPNSLRKFLEMAPNKPKPPKINSETLKVWGLKNTNDQSILRVLKKIDLLSTSGETTSHYSEFMKKESGATTLGKQIMSVYKSLFDNVPNPDKASDEELKNFFNIHSGGGEQTIKYQIDTFKALANFASFDGNHTPVDGAPVYHTPEGDENDKPKSNTPSIHIDLHIHLPENKSKADYESIIESIADKIFKYKS